MNKISRIISFLFVDFPTKLHLLKNYITPPKKTNLDEKVTPLVHALDDFGVTPIASCQGHYPTDNAYVSFISSKEQSEKIYYLLKEFTERHNLSFCYKEEKKGFLEPITRFSLVSVEEPCIAFECEVVSSYFPLYYINLLNMQKEERMETLKNLTITIKGGSQNE